MPFRRPPLGGFFGDTEEPESEERFDDTWQDLAARHPELANLRSPWATWGARKRRGSAAGNERPTAGNERPTTDFGNDSRNRFFRDGLFDNIPPEFRERIPTRWNQHFEPDTDQGRSQTIPNQEQQQFQQPASPESPTHNLTDKSTQTAVGEANAEKNLPKQSLPQYGLRNTVDLGQKTAAEAGQLDAESARNQRSMSAPPDGRFSSPQRSHSNSNNTNAAPSPNQPQQTEQTNNKQPNVRVIPIFVEGRDEPVINSKTEKTAPFTESRPTPPKDDDFFVNHDIPHGFQKQPQFGRNFGTQFKNFGNRPTTGSAFGPSKVFQQQQRHPPQQEPAPQTYTFKAPPQAANKTAHEEAQKPAHAQNESQYEEQPRQQSPQPSPQSQTQPINDAISKIQLIQKDVLELMTSVENFSGKTKKDKEYIYLDEMLTRNLLKLDDIETEGKENIRLARREAIKCIQKCIAVLEAKAENASTNHTNRDVSAEDQTEKNNISCESDADADKVKPDEEKMDVVDESQKSVKSIGKKKRDKSKDNKNGASGVQKMDVERVDEQCENKNAVSATTDAQVVDKCKNNTNGSSAAMEVDSTASSQ
ncbi:BAG domain-containing protein starvin isoform X2 [Arctopsyche grandis]|uniref:BAG domain-containing protein starvin isoform X2 n=1 Tax=Arctopsyche grandis TaxID=121162 RepID=UPI00406D9277